MDAHRALVCPGCQRVDLDFDELGDLRVRCSFCGAVVQVTEKRIFPRDAGRPADVVELHGEIASTTP
jgi:hypothetical protein